MPNLPGGLEWVIILIVVLLLFGVGRIGKIAGELGSGIRAFKEGLQGKDEDKDKDKDKEKAEENKDQTKAE
jgi:sec-independent protein translocase protein TatA